MLKEKLKSSKLHIVVDCRKINDSGIGTYIKNILPGIVDADTFITTILGYKEELKKFEWFKQVKFIAIRSAPLSFAEHLELSIKIPRCDIYWAPNINSAILPTRARNRVTTIHDVYHLAHPGSFSKLKILFLKVLINASLHHSKFIITVSEFSKNEIIRHTHCPADKIKVIPLAVNATFNEGFTFNRINEKFFLAVGNIKPYKNLENALAAFKKLNAEEFRFYIVGKKDGFLSGYNNFKKLVGDIGDRVRFTGYVCDEELKNYYANAAAFVFPSKYEGFGLPVLEAMKFKIPVLASKAASIPEVGGDAITYFDPSDVTDITQKMAQVLKDNFKVDNFKYEQQLGKFNWNKTTEEHLTLFSSFK